MKVWTYLEMVTKAMTDLDMQDETFVQTNEFIGYFNEGIEDAQAEILALDKDYFLTKYFVPVKTGQAVYPLPYQIFANKIRNITYQNGSVIYEIKRFRRANKFDQIALINGFGPNDDYSYFLTNDVLGQAKIQFVPPIRETAVIAPVGNQFTPIVMWFLRNCVRVPLIGELCNVEVVNPVAQVNLAASTIQTYAGNVNVIGVPQQFVPGGHPGSIPYVTGDVIQFSTASAANLPSPLVADINYYVIAMGGGVIKVATTLQNAFAGTAITFTSQGSLYFNMRVTATIAIINATLIDIPEFATYLIQWAKICCMSKESDPRIENEAQKLVQQKQQMVSSLTNDIPDDDDKIEADFTFYQDSN